MPRFLEVMLRKLGILTSCPNCLSFLDLREPDEEFPDKECFVCGGTFYVWPVFIGRRLTARNFDKFKRTQEKAFAGEDIVGMPFEKTVRKISKAPPAGTKYDRRRSPQQNDTGAVRYIDL